MKNNKKAKNNNNKENNTREDINIIKLIAQCFDRRAFQDGFYMEGSMESFDKAIEETITAINTGILYDNEGKIRAKGKGKSNIVNSNWNEKLGVIVKLLQEIRERYCLAVKNKEIMLGTIHMGQQMYFIKNPELSKWMDEKRNDVLRCFENITKEANIKFNTKYL